MSLVFWLPFAAGTVYSLRKEVKKPLGWGLPMAFMTSTTAVATLRVLGNEKGIIHPHDMLRMPKTFLACSVATGTFFCMGHLFTKMAYPVFTDEIK